VNFVGKKYDDYQKAAVAEGMAKERLSNAEGGSAQGVIQQSKNDAQSAEVISTVLWDEFLEDPEG
jgi:hypothetical protein